MSKDKISFSAFATDALPDEKTFQREVKALMERENITEQEAASKLYRKYMGKDPDRALARSKERRPPG